MKQSLDSSNFDTPTIQQGIKDWARIRDKPGRPESWKEYCNARIADLRAILEERAQKSKAKQGGTHAKKKERSPAS